MVVLLVLSACAEQPGAVNTPVAGPEALGLDRPMAPLTGPVTVGVEPWLPFTRYCESLSDLALVAGQSIPSSRRNCASLLTEPVVAGWRRLTVTATEGDFVGAALTVEHSAMRQVVDTSYKASSNADLSVQEVRAWNQAFETRLRGIAVPQMAWIARQGDTGSATESLTRFEGFHDPKDWTVTCRVEGASAVTARDVIVASCDGVNPMRFTDPARRIDLSATMALTYWVAVDVATGAFRRSAASTRLDGTRTEAGLSQAVTGTGWATTTLD